jgi:PPOX class probable F420-dependent enzyme
MGTRPDLTMSPSDVHALLEEPNVGVLTTLDRDGWPHSAGMWFFVDGDELCMWTYGKSQKTQNLRRDPRAALLVERGEPYLDLRGVLVRGHVRVVSDEGEVAAIGARIYDKYVAPKTGLRSDEGPQLEIQRQATKRVGLVLPLEKIVSWDHSKALS